MVTLMNGCDPWRDPESCAYGVITRDTNSWWGTMPLNQCSFLLCPMWLSHLALKQWSWRPEKSSLIVVWTITWTATRTPAERNGWPCPADIHQYLSSDVLDRLLPRVACGCPVNLHFRWDLRRFFSGIWGSGYLCFWDCAKERMYWWKRSRT